MMAGIKITNAYAIQNLWTIEQLAEALLKQREKTDFESDTPDGRLHECGTYDVYITSDGQEYSDYDIALEHEIDWLCQEVDSIEY